MNLTSYRRPDPSHILHPAAEIYAGGWRSDIGTLVRYGWKIDLQEDPGSYDAYKLYVRNPDKGMVGTCTIENLHIQQFQGQWGAIAYMDEQLLIRTEMHREMQIPQATLYEVGVGIVHEHPSGELHWQMYTPDKQETEIIVTPEKIPRIMEEILKAQMPRAKEIIHSQRRREYQKLEAKATILAFG